MNDEKEYGLEIDFVEWIKEIKNHIAVIVITTLLFAAAAGLYLYKFTGPVYSYTLFINCSNNFAEKDRLTFVNLFRNDIGIVDSQKSGKRASLTNVELVNIGTQSKDIKDRFTNLMRFQFTGNDPDYVKQYGSRYVNGALEQINRYIEVNYESNFSKEYLNTVKDELRHINDHFARYSAISEEAVRGTLSYLVLLKERLETKEINKAFKKASIAESQNKNARKTVNRSIIWKSAFLGFFLSFVYVTGKYLVKVVR
jgi:hypothetical protein